MNRYQVILGAFLMGIASQSVQSMHAFTDFPVEITINSHLSDAARLKPSVFKVGFLRSLGINTIEITVRNASQEAIVINPHLFSDISCMAKETVTDVVWRWPQRVKTAASVLGISSFIAMAVYYGLFYYLGHNAPVIESTLHLSLVQRIFWGLVSASLVLFSPISSHVEHAIWQHVCASCLFDSVVIQPGQEVKRFVFIDSLVELPQTFMCRITDASGMQYLVPANRQ